MSELADYIRDHTDRGECQCGKCFDKGDRPDPGHSVDMMFFVMSLKDNPVSEKLQRLVKEHDGEYGSVDIFDGKEHGYMELGGWLGSQDLALRFMGMGHLMDELFDLMTPENMLPKGTDKDLLMQLATSGMITIRCNSED